MTLRCLGVFTKDIEEVPSERVLGMNMSRYFRLILTIWNLLFDIHKGQLVLGDRSLSHLSIQILPSSFRTPVSFQVHISLYYFFHLLQSTDSNRCLFYMVYL